MIQKGMEKARNEALDSLKAERAEAREEGEWDKVDAIEEDMDSLKAEAVAPEIVNTDEEVEVTPGPITPERARQFAKDNPWMYTDKSAQTDAIAKSNEYANAYPDASAEEIIGYVTKEMKELRPDLYANEVVKPKPTRMVAGQGRAPARQAAGAKGKTTGTTYASLTQQEKRQCDLYVRSTGNTAEQYCADIDLLG